MKFYDEQLQKLQEQIARKRQLEAQVSELRTQRSTLSTRVRELEAIKMQEQADVDKLEGRSLAAFFYNVIGKMDEQLNKEREEAYWKTAAVAKLLQSVYVLLWSLLLIIPGIIATYSYAMTEFILAEHPDLTASEAIAQSKEMMSGNRWRLFCLHFSFIGWDILSSLTLGIGNLWLRPYKQAANAAFYREISGTGYAAFDPSYS